MDVRAWRSILTGWHHQLPQIIKEKKSLKPEVDWSKEDERLANYNTKALHAIFNGCDTDHIKLISSYKTAKEAWDILQNMFEGSGVVKRNKLLSFTIWFENLRILDDEFLF